jgi:hypothetical protein
MLTPIFFSFQLWLRVVYRLASCYRNCMRHRNQIWKYKTNLHWNTNYKMTYTQHCSKARIEINLHLDIELRLECQSDLHLVLLYVLIMITRKH